jgi:hypothetical protein
VSGFFFTLSSLSEGFIWRRLNKTFLHLEQSPYSLRATNGPEERGCERGELLFCFTSFFDIFLSQLNETNEWMLKCECVNDQRLFLLFNANDE